MRAFVIWGRELSTADRENVDRYFDKVEFENELAALPGKYSRPAGSLLIAYHDGHPAGCVAMRPLAEGFCEMKRLYVPPVYHGQGIGRMLADRIIADASSAGYKAMRLDTSRNQLAAIGLYQRLGFRRIASYYPIPDAFKDWLIFFEKDLKEPLS